MDIAVLPGDDIGPEILGAALAVLNAAQERFSLGLNLETFEVGMARHRVDGTTLPDDVLQAVGQADGIILGPAGMTAYPPASEGGINIPGTVRKTYDLYANLRPARSRNGLARALPGLDCMIVRENTEGFYADRNMFAGSGEFMPTQDVALSVRKITRHASRRIAEAAFALAERRSCRITVVGKRHVLKVSDGLFMEEVIAEAKAHPTVTVSEVDIDAMVAALYTSPEAFDVILITNMFGDILSNLAVALSGGLGLAASLNRGEHRSAANAGHGSAPDIAGQNVANPAGIILSVAMLLDDLGQRRQRNSFVEAGAAINAAVDVALADDAARTRDLGGRGTTSGFGKACAAALLAAA